MENVIFLASCPVCGRSLFKGSPLSYMELGCPKCKTYLSVKIEENGIMTTVKETKNKI